jgi:hypothetical protein
MGRISESNTVLSEKFFAKVASGTAPDLPTLLTGRQAALGAGQSRHRFNAGIARRFALRAI